MFLDLESYSDYIASYKTFMFDVAKVVAREMNTGVTDDALMADVEAAFEFERSLALPVFSPVLNGLDISCSIWASTEETSKDWNLGKDDVDTFNHLLVVLGHEVIDSVAHLCFKVGGIREA